MPRRSVDSENLRDNNWHRLWERSSKKSHRQRARLRRLSSHPSLIEESVVLAHSSSSQDPVAMTSNPANQSLEDHFLCWLQDMETKQEEQTRDRWLNCRAMLTICIKKITTYGLVWKENGLKMHEGAATLHPRLNKIKARSLSS